MPVAVYDGSSGRFSSAEEAVLLMITYNLLHVTVEREGKRPCSFPIGQRLSWKYLIGRKIVVGRLAASPMIGTGFVSRWCMVDMVLETGWAEERNVDGTIVTSMRMVVCMIRWLSVPNAIYTLIYTCA